MVHISCVFTDSRGRRLNECIQIENDSGCPIYVYFFPGAGLQKLTEEALQYARHNPSHTIYIMGGINDFTKRDPQTKRVTFPFTNFDQLASHVVHLLLEADCTLRQRKPDTMFVFCPIVGMDLGRYAKIHDANAQLILNQAVHAINEQITVLNKTNRCITPWTASAVLKSRHGKIYEQYEHLYDGLHPSESALKSWAKVFIRAVKANF